MTEHLIHAGKLALKKLSVVKYIGANLEMNTV
jgi:hypothetical protein